MDPAPCVSGCRDPVSPVVVACVAVVGAACGPRLRAAVFRRAVRSGTVRRGCPHCAVPVLAGRPAWAGLPVSGRCPGCRGRLGPPAGSVEVVTAAVFAALAARVGSVPLLVALCAFALPGVALAVVDVAVGRLPDVLTGVAGTGLLAGLVVAAVAGDQAGALWRALLAGVVLAAGYLALAVASPSSLGFGDCKLAAGIGAALGWFGWPTVFAGTLAAFGLAAVYGVCLVALGRASRRDAIPFGPFMLLGALLAVLAG